MRIRLRTTYASPKVTAVGGSIIDVPEKEAVELVSGGYAEYCKETKVETATMPQKETAATRIGKPRRGSIKSQRVKDGLESND